MLPFCKVIFHTAPTLFVLSSLKSKSGFYIMRKTEAQSHQTKGGLRKSRFQPLDPRVSRADGAVPLSPGCGLWVDARSEGGHWVSSLLREGHGAGETLFSLPGNFQSWELGAAYLGQLGVLPGRLCSALPLSHDYLPTCFILLYSLFQGGKCW